MRAVQHQLAIIIAAVMMITSAVPVMAETAYSDAAGTDAAPAATAQEMLENGEYSSDEIIVVFDDSVKNSRIENTIESEDAACTEIAETAVDTKLAVAEIDENVSLEEAIETFAEKEQVLYAQPNYRYEITSEYGTDDPYNNDESMNQWYLTNIRARDAWKVLRSVEAEAGLAPVKVAVIDTGADTTHEELQEIISEDSVRIEGAGRKTLTKDSSSDGHGTHACGIIGAAADNGKGIAGVASGAGDFLEIIAIDATSQDDAGEYFDTYGVVSAIEYAMEKNADIINMSLGGAGTDLVLESAVEKAYEAGITVVAAAGNENTDDMITPSDHNEVISVCSTTKTDERYAGTEWTTGSGSNYGQPKDISAPGVSIISTVPGGYKNLTGTSMAAPMVSAAAAMLYAVNPDLTPAQIRNILCGTARDTAAAGYDYYTGYGVVNLLDAVNAALSANESIPAEKVEFKEDADYVKRIGVAERSMLEVLITPANTMADVMWTSSDESVAAVDSKGKVLGVSAGTAVITCTAGGASASCRVEVQNFNEPASVAVTNADKAAAMVVGDTFNLETEIQPRYADQKEVYWTSSDMSVVTVDELGKVTARGEGEAQILGYVYNSPYKDFETLPAEGDPLTAVVDVKVYKAVSEVTLVSAPAKVKLGNTVTFTAKASPDDALRKEISWYSSNSKVAKIDKNTGVLTPVAPGYVTITARSDNGKSAAKKILVYTTSQTTSAYGLTAKSTGYNSIKLTWKGIPNADGYVVYRGGKAVKRLSPGTRSYTGTKLTCGKTYKYYVKAYYTVDGKRDYCKASAAKSVKPMLKKPSVSTTVSKGKITVKWGKVSGTTKYQVYKYSSTKKKYVRVATVKNSKYKYVDKNVKKGKKYYYKVRSYRTVSGKKVYGPFSARVVRTAR